MSKIVPLSGYVLIDPIEDEQKSAGGVYLPDSSKDKPSKGKVVAIGEPYTDFNTYCPIVFVHSPVKLGQTVLYKKWVNQEVQHEGKEYLLVKFDEILAIIK